LWYTAVAVGCLNYSGSGKKTVTMMIDGMAAAGKMTAEVCLLQNADVFLLDQPSNLFLHFI
jgi:hypothetical protein